jgi:hypothetical protein
MFFGTPHQGSLHSGGGDFINNLTSILSPENKTRATKELELWSPELLQIMQDFAAIADKFSFTSFWEKQKTKGLQVCLNLSVASRGAH